MLAGSGATGSPTHLPDSPLVSPSAGIHPGAEVDQHPQYRMWKDRLETEQGVERARAELRAARELASADWHIAWASYKARRDHKGALIPLPRWWNILGWVRWLMKLHAPGRPG
jgi:hypothetical protein